MWRIKCVVGVKCAERGKCAGVKCPGLAVFLRVNCCMSCFLPFCNLKRKTLNRDT